MQEAGRALRSEAAGKGVEVRGVDGHVAWVNDDLSLTLTFG